MTALTRITQRLSPRPAIRQRMLARVYRRRGDVPLPFELEYRHIYIIPTVFGFAFGIMLIFMALGGLNFNNNMALLLVFLLGSVAQVTTLLSYRNLVGLRVSGIRSESVFAGEHAHFAVHISNNGSRDRLSLQTALTEERVGDCIDLPALSTRIVKLNVTTENRGWCKLPAFRLETRYPMGLFQAWTWFFPTARCLVYPAPSPNPPPLPRSGAGSQGRAMKGDGEQVHGLRTYHEGDPLSRVAWRTSARHDQLYTREMETPQEESCILAWDLLQSSDTEERLAILTAWVLQADHHQITWSLHLPARKLGPATGASHRADCLEALALYGK